MKRLHHPDLSLRTRLILWQFIVLVPLLLSALFHHLYLMPHFTKPLQQIADEITNEVLRVKSLQLTLHTSAMPVNDYLIHGNRREIEAFSSQRQRVDVGFANSRAIPFGEEEETQLIETAWQEWQQAKQLATELLSIDAPQGKADLGKKMELFDAHIDAASAQLEELYNLAYEEIKEAQKEAHAAHAESKWLSIATLLVALVLSLILGSALTRSIISSLKSLHQGAGQFATGQFDHQVHAGGIHEFEELANAFNAMAAKLQAHDAMLEDLAKRDALTGLENRRSLDMRLSEELQRCGRYRHPCSLLMLDIDHFKLVNDTYGHPAGDAVLYKLASVIEEVVRPMDRVFRYGGEEFVVLVPETPADGAYSLAERIRQAIAATVFSIGQGKDIHITISIGIATYSSGTDTNEILIAAADNALYKAKQNGRNCVFIRSDVVRAI